MKSLAILLLLTSAAIAGQPPRAQITGPTSGSPGDFLELSIGMTNVDHVRWEIEPDKFADGRDTHRVLEGGARCEIASRPGVYHVLGIVANADGIDTARYVVTVPGIGPMPPLPPAPAPVIPPTPPTPAPPTPPAPVVPVIPPAPVVPSEPTFSPGTFGVSLEIYRAASKINSPNRAVEAQALANCCEAIAASISAGTLSGAQKILSAILAANNAALGSSVTAWAPFGQALSARIKDFYVAGKLADNAAWAQLLREAAAGLRAVK